MLQAPQRLSKTLAHHVKTLRTFLEPFHELISKAAIRDRLQNVRFIPSVENAVPGFEGVLNNIEDEVKQYLKVAADSSTYTWGGRGSWKRVKYSFNKSSLLELEARLLGRMSALHMALSPMDLSWTIDLTDDDRDTIATLRRRADSLDTAATGPAASMLSLVSLRSVGSWAGIDDDDSRARNILPAADPDPNIADRIETLEQKREPFPEETQNSPFREDQNIDEDEIHPWKKKVTIWSGEHHISGNAYIDTGSMYSIIHKKWVHQLEAPVNHLTTPSCSVMTSTGAKIRTEGTVVLVLKLEDSSEFFEARFHVLPLSVRLKESRCDILLGTDWLTMTEMFERARLMSLES